MIELKRTNDGGRMALQAIRYAGMVSAMASKRAEQTHGEFLKGGQHRRSPDEIPVREICFPYCRFINL